MKNKISFIFLIVIAFIAIFSAKCFATITGTSLAGDTVEFPDFGEIALNPETGENFTYCLIALHDGQYEAHFSDNPFTYYYHSSSGRYFVYNNRWYCWYILNNGVWSDRHSTSSGLLQFDSSALYYSNADILDSNGEVVFQKASQPIVETQGTLAKIVEEQEMEKVMEEILGILPIVIVVIVSLIAIRKAIQWIRQTLKQQ